MKILSVAAAVICSGPHECSGRPQWQGRPDGDLERNGLLKQCPARGPRSSGRPPDSARLRPMAFAGGGGVFVQVRATAKHRRALNRAMAGGMVEGLGAPSTQP